MLTSDTEEEKLHYKEIITGLLSTYDRQELREISKALNRKLHRKTRFKTCLACDSRTFKLARGLRDWWAICNRCGSNFTLAELHLRMIQLNRRGHKKSHKLVSYAEYTQTITTRK